jgi:hypothetical protein
VRRWSVSDGLINRFSMIFKAKASKMMDRYEDLQEILEMLQKTRTGHRQLVSL